MKQIDEQMTMVEMKPVNSPTSVSRYHSQPRGFPGSEAQLSQFVQWVPGAVAMVDRQLRYHRVSRGWISQWIEPATDGAGEEATREMQSAVVGRSLWDTGVAFPREIVESCRVCLAQTQSGCEEVVCQQGDGSEVLMRWQIQPWYRETGELGGVMLFSEAIGDRVASENIEGNEASLRQEYLRLKALFEERTAQLKRTNQRLMSEIHEREEAEVSLRKHAQMLDLANDTIMILDLNYRITYWNRGAERLYGWTREEAMLQPVHDFLHSQFPQPPSEIKATLLRDGYWQGELIHTKRDGTQIVVASRWTLQRDEAGKPTAILEINHDISDRKKAEDALRNSEAALREKNQQLEQTLLELQKTQAQLIQTEKMSSLGQLVAGVAHEINNPVNFIYGNLNHARQYMQDSIEMISLYQAHYPDPVAPIKEFAEEIELDFVLEDLPKMLGSMQIGAERIREIVRSLRNFSRVDQAKCKAVDIHEGIENTLLLLKHRFKEKPGHPKIEIIKEFGDIGWVDCYAGQINQVFMNILSNAIDALEEIAMREGSSSKDGEPLQIRIRTERKGDRAVIRISDNGPGIPESVRRQLFDPFFTTKPPGKGTGLGLAIGYQIVVEKHRGNLQCTSTPGKGTEFTIEIPCNQCAKKRG
ncbi:PAS domain-containing sensor histidine kinase [Phormidium sp. CCY1219]|uniref:PAS domain-containing sensor histidine kinase n=1 Tax=Phormidium sp. CCY1219 TaxID=2886104 RepID=UPI002D1EEDD7|nr:ATP-binding protein [Phormidium sp. CCY1219]MEB3826709.1 PAS domain S-box protein [Phormidium sp. CCY1219]